MEVHAHTHTANTDSHRGRKKWTHYFWEFLMLFLAVFCGFFAENQREHFIENKRARDYAVSLLSDVKEDIVDIKGGLSEVKFLISAFDSIQAIVSKNGHSALLPGTFYYYSRFLTLMRPVDWSTSTLNQLIQSGSLRYFSNKELVRRVNLYYSWQQYITRRTASNSAHREKLREIRNEILDEKYSDAFASLVLSREAKGHVPSPLMDSLMQYKLSLQEGGERHLARLMNHTGDQREDLIYFLQTLYPTVLRMAEELIKQIKEEYHLSEGTPLEK